MGARVLAPPIMLYVIEQGGAWGRDGWLCRPGRAPSRCLGGQWPPAACAALRTEFREPKHPMRRVQALLGGGAYISREWAREGPARSLVAPVWGGWRALSPPPPCSKPGGAGTCMTSNCSTRITDHDSFLPRLWSAPGACKCFALIHTVACRLGTFWRTTA